MKKILIRAEQPGGNISLLEEQLSDVVRKFLDSPDKECSVAPYEGIPMKMSEAAIKGDANYVLYIALKEK
jgi:hypothetical protein